MVKLVCYVLVISLLLSTQLVNCDIMSFLTGMATNALDSMVKMFGQNCLVVRKLLFLEYANMIGTILAPNMKTLQMYLYNGSFNNYVVFDLHDAASEILNSSVFNPDLRTVIYIHGFLDDMRGSDVYSIASNLLQVGGVNVLALDTKSYIQYEYLSSSVNVQVIGENLATFLVQLYQAGVPPGKIHLIGFSLGAHIVGLAGQGFTNATGLQIARITGLDPASPCFFDQSTDHKLSPSDGGFVDVIHTHAGAIGIADPCGDADFYPNGGTDQPGAIMFSTSHNRVWEFYASSILNPTIFPAVPCPDSTSFYNGSCDSFPKVYMGYAVPEDAKGTYYLITSGTSPYGLG